MPSAAVFAACAAAFASPADLALPAVGTDNSPELSCGNVYPCISRPWGTHSWTPQTGDDETGWIYLYSDRKIRGIRLTHQPSPWIGDYGQFSLMPAKELESFDVESRSSWFSHKTETAKPYCYKVYLADHDTTVEIAPSRRAAVLRATHPATERPQFVIDAFPGGEITSVGEYSVEGVSRAAKVRWNEKTPAHPLENRFRVEFDRRIVSHSISGETCRVDFAPTAAGERTLAFVAASFVSAGQARRNLGEVAGRSLEEVADEGRREWNEALSRISIETADLDVARMFYTCLYRSLLFPRMFHDVGESGGPVHASPHGPGIRAGEYWCDTGFWDTFRALFPLLNFAYPETARSFAKGLANCAEEGGWLPEWSSPGYRDCMIGNNSASVAADAFLSGAADAELAGKLYAAVLHDANAAHPSVSSEGRPGFRLYNEKGYVPRDAGIEASAARTIEYSYADWCAWRLGSALGRPAGETEALLRRAGSWRNVFDTSRLSACGRNSDGSFAAGFDPELWGVDFIEGTPLHYTWSVFHDVSGLVAAMGGRDRFNAALDAMFTAPPAFKSPYPDGTVTHEMREMQTAGFGQYAHGNQPVQHAAYLYCWSGRPWRTQKLVNEIAARLYRPSPDGYCGDEDNGQTSAWYVWSCLGLYPVCPPSGQYAIGAPQVPRATVSADGFRISIRAVGRDGAPVDDFSKTPYVESLAFNGESVERNWLSREELRRGGELVFTMSAEPNLSRGVSPETAPYSLSADASVPPPSGGRLAEGKAAE